MAIAFKGISNPQKQPQNTPKHFLENKFCSPRKMCKFAIPFGKACICAFRLKKGWFFKIKIALLIKRYDSDGQL